MNGKILLSIYLIILISNAQGEDLYGYNKECTDCANGYKIITDVFFCKNIFGDPNCNNDECRADYLKYKECSFTGCFGDMSNFSDISEFNNCLEKCVPTTEIVKAFAKGLYNCMEVASSSKLIYSILLFFGFFLIF